MVGDVGSMVGDVVPPTLIRVREEARTHLFRGGAPSVRSWSKYKETVHEWTLCGIRRSRNPRTTSLTDASEDHRAVNCPFCQELMRPTKAELARAKKKAKGATP